MNRFIIIPLIALMALGFGSCLHVFQPLFSENQLIAPAGVTGKWLIGTDTVRIETYEHSELKKMLNISESTQQPLSNSGPDSTPTKLKRTYILSYDIKNIKYYFSLQVGLIGSDYYAQLMPLLFIPDNDKTTEEESRYNAFWAEDVVSTYAIAKVRITSNKKLEMKFLDGDLIKKQILGGQIRIAHAYDEVFENLLVTASSADLVAFIKKYNGKEELFDVSHTYTFSKTGSE